jgi:D-amino peptidase
MEGTVGAVAGDQMIPGGFEYERMREFMTGETNAAIKAAKAMGATRIVVADSHGNGQNLIMEKLPQDILLVRSWPRPLTMAQGIETGKFDAALFIGYHAPEAYPDGPAVMAHTWIGMGHRGLRINGKLMSEGALTAAMAGHFGVPVVMVSGDESTVKHMRGVIGEVEGAVVKWAYNNDSALTLMPQAAYDLIAQKTKAALSRLQEFEPFRLQGPITVDLTLSDSNKADSMAFKHNLQRIDSLTVRYIADDIMDVWRFLPW